MSCSDDKEAIFFMNRNKVVAAIALTTVACTAVTGCAPKATDTVITIDNNGKKDKLTYGYVNFVCKYNQARIDQVDLQYMGKDYWNQTAQQSSSSSSQSSSGSSETNEESAKDYIYQNMQGQYIAKQHASEVGVKLTSDDKKAIEKAAKKFMSSNSDTAIKQVGATEEYVEDYLEYETYYEKVRGKLESEADDTVTDKEANQSTFTYALFSTKSDSSSSASGDSEMSAKDKAKLKAKAEKVAAAADFDKEAKAEKADTSTYSYTTAEDPADDEAMDEKVIAAAQKLQNGEVSDVIEVKDRGYYVIRMDKTHDESATKDKKKSLASQKREAAFNKQMNTWKKKIRFTLDKKLWKQIKFTDLFTTASGNATR